MQKYHVTKCLRWETFSENFLRKCTRHVQQLCICMEKRNKKGTKYIWTCTVAATQFNVSVNVFLKKKKTTAKSGKYSARIHVHTKFTQCTVMHLLCCAHASFPAHLKITQISGTSGSQVDLSVYLSDCLSRHLIARCLFHPLTDEPFQDAQ